MRKEEIEKKLEDIERLTDQTQQMVRLEWLNRVCREAKELGFNNLGELTAWMVDHASEVQLKEGPEIPEARSNEK